MKTTVELPDTVFRQAKAAAQHGVPLKEFFTEALRAHLRRGSRIPAEKPWMRSFGALRDLRSESKRLDGLVRKECERVDEEEWR